MRSRAGVALRGLILGLVTLLPVSQVRGESQTAFAGVPTTKIIESGLDRVASRLSPDESSSFSVVISEMGSKFYWATRENKEMVRYAAGAFVTYMAVDGSGYVRVIDPASKQAAALSSATEAQFDYVEHILLGLRSVTYYGKTR